MPSGSATTSRTCARCGISSRAGLVDGLERRAGELELAARLERDRAAADRVGEPDDVLAVHDRLPAEQRCMPRAAPDAARALVGDRRMVVRVEAELLVLGAERGTLRWAWSPCRTRRPVRRGFRSASGRTGHGPCGDFRRKRARHYTRAARKSNAASLGHLGTATRLRSFPRKRKCRILLRWVPAFRLR